MPIDRRHFVFAMAASAIAGSASAQARPLPAGRSPSIAQLPNGGAEAGFIVENADGSGRQAFTHAGVAASRLKDGQTLRILKNPSGAWIEGMAIHANRVRIVGENGAQLQGIATDGVGLIAGYGDDLTVENLEIFNVHGDGAANGIRFNGKNLTVRNVRIRDCDMGFLSAGDNGTILFENVVISDCRTSLGLAHNIYVGSNGKGTATQFIFRRSQSLRANDKGHLLKSRALATTIEDSVLAMDNANSSRCIDISDGGEVIIRRNVIEQGPNSDNEDIIGIALELPGEHLPPTQTRHHATLVSDNIVISDFSAQVIGLVHTRSPAATDAANNFMVTAPNQFQFFLLFPDNNPRQGLLNDRGGNKIIHGRPTAGFQPFPWLPPVPKA